MTEKGYSVFVAGESIDLEGELQGDYTVSEGVVVFPKGFLENELAILLRTNSIQGF